uniref:Vomeronasal type-1 receptor n=1 Tax=Microcebus murinus TaxID=30608 RepID=A0A1P8NUN0_MICMU|nr:vomeronasal 1 receptor VN1R-Mmur075 [Microcebus murinus]APX52270.1 vomeronasal 1 receptor VN1R-Mmur075 [Microcebus murinus]APX52271.1 vomeronasal 1 receptor VN1R-Mmur075 [Microcebus murinus]APX52272.1 vomeronasal 1 receptor VN1R-Mmur075 [Microcebus murinus]APX52273.1 vomeronasal 1 receptor VN1R-Mmur075 [Microcebus murinus]
MYVQYSILTTIWEAALKTIFPLQIGVGTLANVILFFQNVSPILTGLRMRPTHTILAHMAVANSLVLLFTGILHAMVVFVLKKPLSNLGCKLVYYIRVVARSTTLCSTCVLSTYRFLTLVLGSPGTVMLRGRVPKAIGPVCSTCWVFSALLNIYVPVMVTGPQDTNNDSNTQGNWFCSYSRRATGIVFLWSASDAVCICLMGWASGSMMLLLQRHRQRVQHVHTTDHNHRCSPETRATHTVLMLLVIFVTFYMLSSMFTFYSIVFSYSHLWLMHASGVLSSCFPTVCPLLLIFRDPKKPRFCS